MLGVGPGTRIDRYEVHDLLGQGGYGAVYRARHLLTEQWVALKVLKTDATDAHALDRLVREARVVAALGSPHVVKIFDCGVAESGHAFMAMELLQGRDLADLVAREGPFSIERSIDIVLQVLEGLASAHERGIVHRDMKPANVFVEATSAGHDFVKLLDFGISKMRRPDAHPLTLPGMAMGTPGYMAPEQFDDAREADPRADVYACAAILYELLTRQRPYSATTLDELVMQIRRGQARPLSSVAPQVPASLAAMVDRGLARDPDGRWPSARAFSDALRGAVRTVPMPAQSTPRSSPPISVTAPTMPAVPMTPAPKKRPSRAPIVAGAIAVVLLGGAGLAWALASDEKPAAAIAKADEAKPKAKKIEDDEPEDEAPKKKKEKKPASTDSEGGIYSEGGVSIEEPRIIGELDGKEVRSVLKKALPSMKECKRSKKETVLAQVHVHPEGKITLAQAAPDNTGDATAARCVASRFKDAAPGWKPGTGASGIIEFQVVLDAK